MCRVDHQNASRKSEPKTSRRTSYPPYGPGSLLRSSSGGRLLTDASAQTQVDTPPHSPEDNTAYRGGAHINSRNCHATTQYFVGLKCSDDSPLGPAYPTYPRVDLPDDRVLFGRTNRYPGAVTTLPLSREDVYTDKRSARNGHRTGNFCLHTNVHTWLTPSAC